MAVRAMVALESASDEELAELQEEFGRLHRRVTVHRRHRRRTPRRTGEAS
jgi:hypothetical protein